MRSVLLACSLLFTAALACSALAGQFNATLNIGDAAPAWTKLPGTDDQLHSLADLTDREIVVVVFTCNSCPYAVDYEDRVNQLAKQHAGPTAKVGVVAINVNKVESDLLPAMKARAKDKGFVFPYLFDETQQIAKAYGATRTPEFFVLNRERKIVYMGAMDDSPKQAEVKVRHVEDAINAVLQGHNPAKAETPPIGCLIRFARERAKR